MLKKITASDAKNNFGGLLDDVAALGRVEIAKHGRVVAIVFSPRALEEYEAQMAGARREESWGRNHMIPAHLARAATMLNEPSLFDEDEDD